MSWEQVVYAATCVALPVVWGLIVVWLSNRIDRRFLGQRRDGQPKPPPPIEYHI